MKNSAMKTWVEDQSIKDLAKKLELTEREIKELNELQEGIRATLSLQTVWKIHDTMDDRIQISSEEIEMDEEIEACWLAFSNAEENVARLRTEAQQKTFESTQVNTEAVSSEMIQAQNDVACFSTHLHGRCNATGQTWDHNNQKFIDESFLPSHNGNLTDPPSPSYVKNLTRKYNEKVGTARSAANRNSAKVAKAQSRRM